MIMREGKGMKKKSKRKLACIIMDDDLRRIRRKSIIKKKKKVRRMTMTTKILTAGIFVRSVSAVGFSVTKKLLINALSVSTCKFSSLANWFISCQ